MTTFPLEPHITCKCSAIKYSTKCPYPQYRSKHACCLHESHVYLYAGKDGNISLKDFWRLNTSCNKWEAVSLRGDTPLHLEGHSLVSCKKLLLMFGGEFGDSLTESSLWIINPDLGYIRKSSVDAGSERPCIRRYHTAVVHNGAMFVYGGYIDMKGSSSELWKYHIEDEEWELLTPRQSSRDLPGGRHGHTAIVHSNHMWLYGGNNDLSSKSDLWTYSFGVNRWSKVKLKFGPPALSDHTATLVGSRMFIFGGESNREPVNQLWYFSFDTEKWTQIILRDQIPARSFHCAVFVTPSHQDNAIKASSMPYLQKKLTKLLVERPRSSPGVRHTSSSESHRGSHNNSDQDHHRSLQDSAAQSRSVSSRRPNSHNQTSEQYDENKIDNCGGSVNSTQPPQTLSVHCTGSVDSLKLMPSPAENTADKSPLCPKKTDINYNALDALNMNRVGLDNPGISDSTEELIREGRRARLNLHGEISALICGRDYKDGYNHNNSALSRSISYNPDLEDGKQCLRISSSNHLALRSDSVPMESMETFTTCVVPMETELNGTTLVSDIELNPIFTVKKSRLDPELVLEDIEHIDCLQNDVKIQYPNSMNGRYNISYSSESIMLDSDEIETITLNDMGPRARSKSAGDHRLTEVSADLDVNKGTTGSSGKNFESVHFHKGQGLGQDSVSIRSRSENRLLEEARNFENHQRSINGQDRLVHSTHVRSDHCNQREVIRISEHNQREVSQISETEQNGVLSDEETSFGDRGDCYKAQHAVNHRENLYKKKPANISNGKVPKVTKQVEQPYILVIGGKDNKTVHFTVKPIPLWKLQTNPL